MSRRLTLRHSLAWLAVLLPLLLSTPAIGEDPAAPEPSYEGKTISQWQALLQHEDPRRRILALTALSSIGARSLPLFIWALNDTDAPVRSAAVKTIGLLGRDGTPAVPALIEVILNDPVRAVRLQGIYALGQLGPLAADAVPALRSILETADLAMRINVAQALEKIAGTSK